MAQKCRFSQETLAEDEVMKADRRGSKMLAIDRLYIKVHTTIDIDIDISLLYLVLLDIALFCLDFAKQSSRLHW